MQVNPYLMFNGKCEEAFKAYHKILGGEIVAMIPHDGTPAAESVPPEWRKKIIHARLVVGDKASCGRQPDSRRAADNNNMRLVFSHAVSPFTRMFGPAIAIYETVVSYIIIYTRPQYWK